MNIKTPLAAALLLVSTSAMAQFFGPPEDDMIFKCGTVPYRPCTDAELARRKTIQNSGTCPQPVTSACTDYMMRNGGSGVNPAETIAAKDPGDGNEWADPSCTQIPCKLKDKPAPADPDMPPAFDSKTFQQELAKIRAEAKAEGDENTYVDLGNNRYGVVTPDGKVRACGPSSCNAKPIDVSKFPGLADKIQAAKSLNSGNDSINADNPDGNMSMKTKGFTPDDKPGDKAGDKPEDKSGDEGVLSGLRDGGGDGDAPGEGGTSGAARNLGAGIANDQANLAKGFGATGAGGAGGGAGGGGATTVASLDASVIKVDGSTIKNDGVFTYTKMRKASDGVGKAAGTFNTGNMTGFASPGSSPNGVDPQVDPATLGKTKAGANN